MARTNYASDRLQRLKQHLQLENSDLTEAVDCYESLDAIARRMGLLAANESYANQISWWPLVSVLGTFSSGKSSFINSWLGMNVQRSGNQAVDDHFTILAYGADKHVKTLPGQALDSDPRFPFYQISKDIETVSPGDGTRIDKFLQMKVVPSDVLRGKLVIDSPGFDADEQRKATLRITDHIVRLSDLVLVFFDARHPEAGAMQDTLEHLVRAHLNSMDSEKFVYILNQIDTSARDNNLEEIVASWRSSLVQSGLSAGRFYVHYNTELATPVDNRDVWNTYRRKRDADHERIMAHLDELNTVRSYRIVGNIKLLSNAIEEQAVPKLREALKKWRSTVRIVDLVLVFIIIMATLVFWSKTGFAIAGWKIAAFGLASLLTLLVGHFFARRLLVKPVARSLKVEEIGDLRAAFRKSARSFGSVWLRKNPAGWSGRVRRRLDGLRNETEKLIERLNTKNSDPDGAQAAQMAAEGKAVKAKNAASDGAKNSKSPAAKTGATGAGDKTAKSAPAASTKAEATAGAVATGAKPAAEAASQTAAKASTAGAGASQKNASSNASPTNTSPTNTSPTNTSPSNTGPSTGKSAATTPSGKA